MGALLDEYERALRDLVGAISDLAPSDLSRVLDADTKDPDCRSIQSILTHVVQSGYTYTVEIQKWLGEDAEYRDKITLDSAAGYADALWEMFRFCEALFEAHPGIQIVETDPGKKIAVRWGQRYDVEQLMQHAIVHVLRHRRQIERFKMLL